MTYKKKIVMLGDSGVGKTSLVRRFVFDKFEDSYISTIGSKTTVKILKINRGSSQEEVRLIILDVMGRVGYTGAHSRMFKGADGAFLVTDLTRKETLDSLERYWIPLLLGVVENVPLIFIANKSDLVDDYAFDSEDLFRIAQKYNIGVTDALPKSLSTGYLTSAKTGGNVEYAFESLGLMLMSNKRPKDPIKDLYENHISKGSYRQKNKKSLIGVTDAIMVDFCKGFDDERLAILALRQEIIRASLDINKPLKEGLLRLVEFLADAESDYIDEKKVIRNRKRRMSIVKAQRRR